MYDLILVPVTRGKFINYFKAGHDDLNTFIIALYTMTEIS